MGKTAFIFPGQGSQYVGMGKDFYEQIPLSAEIFDLAQEASGLPVAKICFEPNEEIHVTKYTQIAMLAAEIAMLRALEQEGVKADAAAGLSLGEYGALAAARAIGDRDLFALIAKRGLYMQEAVPVGGAMTAVLGLDGAAVEAVCQDIEGLQTMRTLGLDMAWMLKAIAQKKEAEGMPEKETMIQTNFIR